MLATAAWVGRKWGALSRAQASQAALAHIQSLAAELPSEQLLAELDARVQAASSALTAAAKAKGSSGALERAKAEELSRSAAAAGTEVASLLADARNPLAGIQATLHAHPRQAVEGAARILDTLLRASALSSHAHDLIHARPTDGGGYRPSIAEDEAVQMITDIFSTLADAHSYAAAAAREAAEAAAATAASQPPSSGPDPDSAAITEPEDSKPSTADEAMAAYVLDALAHAPGTTHALLTLISPQRAVYTRLSSLRLLARMLHARGQIVRAHVLSAPGGCGEVVEHLMLAIANGGDAAVPTEDEEDADPLAGLLGPPDVQIRGTVLTLLPSLVTESAELAKLIAFGGSFEALLDVIARAGRVEGGQTTHLALSSILALLQGDAAASNGTYFRETGAVVLLPPLLFFPPATAMADPQRLDAFAFQPWPDTPRLAQRKEMNVALVLAIAEALTKPSADPSGATAAALVSGGMVACVSNLACASIAPASVRALALHTIGTLIESEHERVAATTGRGANPCIVEALYSTPVAPLLPAPPPDGVLRAPLRPVPAALVDLALAGDPLTCTWAGEKKFAEVLPVLRAQAAAESDNADDADQLGAQQAHEQASQAAGRADRPLRAAASQAIATLIGTTEAKLAVLAALLPPPIEMVMPPAPPTVPQDPSNTKPGDPMPPQPTVSPQPMPIITPERAKAEMIAGPLLGALVGPPPRDTTAENDVSVSVAAASAAALFATILCPAVGQRGVQAADSVTRTKQAALQIAFDLNGQVCERPLPHTGRTDDPVQGADGESEEDDDDDDDDPREPLLQVVAARATRCLTRVGAVPEALAKSPCLEPAGATAEALLSLLALWVWASPPAAAMLLRESENVHTLLPWRTRLTPAAAAQASGRKAGIARLAGLTSFLLAAVYEWDRASHGLSRRTLQPLLADPQAATETPWLIRNLVFQSTHAAGTNATAAQRNLSASNDDPSALPLFAQDIFTRFLEHTHCTSLPSPALFRSLG